MKSRNKKHINRVKKLIVACCLCAIILSVSTYAWFIGMKTVNVSTFDVTIAAIDSLSLSLTGGFEDDWSDTISISKDTADVDDYNDTNSWGGAGLIPMSSVGKIDSDASRLILFEKGSLTTSPGGYRLMASRVKNTGEKEANGYVVFDLFIRNLSGNEYYKEYDEANEEAIYLTIDSMVLEKKLGADVKNSGIENSVRVAFAQIGRVKAKDYVTSVVQGITCTDDENVTSICSRDAQIWEPNDSSHVQNAINWYMTSCKKRNEDGATITDPDSYVASYETCNKIGLTDYVQTYAVSGEILETDNVDVYDGAAYNTYTGSVNTEAKDGKLVGYDYFTDTEKNEQGVARPTFITLAPNSITKVRIYIWIEGQDIDNYDFASLGKKISVSFGFTKERFFGEDIDYQGDPALPATVIRQEANKLIAEKEEAAAPTNQP